MSTLKKDVQTGRLLIIDVNNPPDITAEEFMQYIHEGFVPFVKISNLDAQTGAQDIFYLSGPVQVNSTGVVTFPVMAAAPLPQVISFYPETFIVQSITEEDDTSGSGGSATAASA